MASLISITTPGAELIIKMTNQNKRSKRRKVTMMVLAPGINLKMKHQSRLLNLRKEIGHGVVMALETSVMMIKKVIRWKTKNRRVATILATLMRLKLLRRLLRFKLKLKGRMTISEILETLTRPTLRKKSKNLFQKLRRVQMTTLVTLETSTRQKRSKKIRIQCQLLKNKMLMKMTSATLATLKSLPQPRLSK